MKKIFFALAALMAFAFTGCEKDGSETDALTGTTWTSSYEGIPVELSFQKGGQVTLNMDSARYVGTYTYNKPHVTIQMPIEGRNETFTGTYSDGALNISNSEYGSFVFVQTGGPSPDDNSDDAGDTGDQSDVQLVSRIVQIEDEDGYHGEREYVFSYDNKKRIVKIVEANLLHGDYYSYSYTYNGNKVTLSSLQDADCSITLDDNGCIQAGFGHYGETYTFEDGYITKMEEKYQWVTYTWSNGNLVESVCHEEDEEEEGVTTTTKFIYDESVTLPPININLAAVCEFIQPVYQDWDYQAILFLNIWGKHCKSPWKRIEAGPYYAAAFEYAYNADGTIATIDIKIDYDGVMSSVKYSFEYYE